MPQIILYYEQSEFALYQIEKSLLEKNIIHKVDIYPIIGDIRNKNKLKQIIERFKVNTIFHSAAYKHVPMVEANIIEAFDNNVLGTLSCVEAAHEHKVDNFVLISTDKAVRPTNFMGATKDCLKLLFSRLLWKVILISQQLDLEMFWVQVVQ